jgi:D-glycero-D-manno-heptose 1,7-bisphosphate phosphatase
MKYHRAVFLDRDGVLNRTLMHPDGKSHPPANPDEMEVLPGVAEACRALRNAGYLLIVVSNQPDVARGSQKREMVETLNDQLLRQVPLDEIRVCYHDDADNCSCRKPKPGMLQEAATNRRIDFGKSFMVGDRWTDIEAGRRVGCKTVLIGTAPLAAGRLEPDFQAGSLAEAASWILKERQQSQKLARAGFQTNNIKSLRGE